jgi:pimeloyl-ACP methyl ester carboxylesterase
LQFSPERLAKTWHFAFNYLPDLPELLIEGRERVFLSWLFRTKSVNWTAAFDAADVEEYVRIYAAPNRWTAGLGYYRAIFETIAQNKSTAKTPLPMAVMAIGGEFGLGALMREAIEGVAPHLESAVIPSCGHYVPEESPKALLQLLLAFLHDV